MHVKCTATTDYDSQSTSHLCSDHEKSKQKKKKSHKSALLKKRSSDKSEYKLEEEVTGEPRIKKIKTDK